MFNTPPSLCRRGFTMTQLLVIIAVLALLLGFMLYAVQRVRDSGSRAVSQNNLSQITLATVKTADDFNGKMPPGQEGFYPAPAIQEGNGYGPCLFHVLPNLDNAPVYKSGKQNSSIYAAWNTKGKVIKSYFGPGDPTADPTADRTSYVANRLAHSSVIGNLRYPASFSDGTSQTVLFAEAYSVAHDRLTLNGREDDVKIDRNWWTDPTWMPRKESISFQVMPRPNEASAWLPQSHNSAGLQVALADRSVRAVLPNVTSATFYAACTPASDDILGNDW